MFIIKISYLIKLFIYSYRFPNVSFGPGLHLIGEYAIERKNFKNLLVPNRKG